VGARVAKRLLRAAASSPSSRTCTAASSLSRPSDLSKNWVSSCRIGTSRGRRRGARERAHQGAAPASAPAPAGRAGAGSRAVLLHAARLLPAVPGSRKHTGVGLAGGAMPQGRSGHPDCRGAGWRSGVRAGSPVRQVPCTASAGPPWFRAPPLAGFECATTQGRASALWSVPVRLGMTMRQVREAAVKYSHVIFRPS
jgi:hypothetical protein